MLIAMVLFMDYGEDRIRRVKEAYDYFSTFKNYLRLTQKNQNINRKEPWATY